MRARQKILVVDDSVIALDLARMRLEEAGYQVETLDSPFGFSAMLRSLMPDLVLLDVSMPALQGDRLLQIAHKNVAAQAALPGATNRRCPIVLYSDRPEEELGTLARSCGADGFVRKSSNFSSVIQTIQKLIGSPSSERR